MPIPHLVLVFALAASAASATPQECSDWQSCRELAVAAAGRGDYETFHDLAWRTVQKGPKNDPALMLLLAHAQALSGRPGDALVMLQRLADRGIAVDATDPDFHRVRALPGWPDLERRLTAAAEAPASAPPVTPTAPAAAEPPPAPPAPAAATRTMPRPPVPPEKKIAPPAPPDEKTAPPTASPTSEAPPPPDRKPPVASPPPATTAPAAKEAARPDAAEPVEAIRFAEAGLTPDGLAYDGVSRRFLIADRRARKLAVVDEFSQRVATLAGAQADFGEIEALQIDPRVGDLWVVTSKPASAGGETTLHKLQLISGRVLATYTAAAPARFVDVAVGAADTVLVLDTTGRILRLNRGSLELVAPVPPGSTNIAPAAGDVAYVSTTDGLVRVDLASGTVSAVVPPGGIDLSGLVHLRWHRGALIAVQKRGTTARLVRLRLGRGGRLVAGLDLIDTIDAPAGPITIAGDTLYYFASEDGREVVLKKLPL